jgi:hypothetical protein
MDIQVQKEVDVLYGLTETVRSKTLKILKNATENELLWAPPGLSNHILWHAGHAVWLQDVLCIEAITGRGELPEGWHETFSMRCRPVRETIQWPERLAVQEELARQLDRLLTVIGGLSVGDLQGPPRTRSLPDTEPLGYWITHGLHDEANHQGEMHLLLKMHRAAHRIPSP